MKKKSIKYTAYLLKDTVTEPAYALTEHAMEQLGNGNGEEINVTATHSYEDVELYVFYSDHDWPKWSSEVGRLGKLPDEIKINNSGSIFFVKVSGRWLAITFGASFFYLDKRQVVMDFGLKVVVNRLDDKSVKYHEGFEVSKSMRAASQTSSSVPFGLLSNPSTVEIVKSISGVLDKQTLSGSTSFKFASEERIEDVKQGLEDALLAYGSQKYKTTKFAVIDKLSPVKDKPLVEQLNDELVAEITQPTDEFELGLPILTDHSKDIAFLRLMSVSPKGTKPPEFTDLSLQDYQTALGSELANLDIKKLKYHHVSAHDSNGEFVHASNVFKCLIGTLESNASGDPRKYVLNEGQWFLVSDDFKKNVDDFFLSVRDIGSDNEFDPPLIIPTGKKKKDGLEPELDYNTRIASTHGYILLDQKLVPVPDEPGRGFEICDILDLTGKRLIHVKKSSRQSSILSHFIAQGIEPLSYLSSSDDFRQLTHDEIAKQSPSLAKEFLDADLKDFTVHYLIVDSPRKSSGEFNIPFFSRITLFDRAKSIGNYAKGTSVSFIDVPT